MILICFHSSPHAPLSIYYLQTPFILSLLTQNTQTRYAQTVLQHLRLLRTKWTSPLQLPKSLIHEGLAPLCVPDACCMPFATILLTHLCTSRGAFLLYRTHFPIKQKQKKGYRLHAITFSYNSSQRNRTAVFAVRGRRLSRLTNEPYQN